MSEFVTFASLQSNLGLYRELEVSAPAGRWRYIAVLGEGDDLLVYLGQGDDGFLVLANKEGGQWRKLLGPKIRVDNELRVMLNPRGEHTLDVCLPDGSVVRLRTKSPLHMARALAGVGDWQVREVAGLPQSSDGLEAFAGPLSEVKALPQVARAARPN